MERAADVEYWLYHVLQNGLVKSTAPRISASKLAGLVRQADTDRPWMLEISGRALSLAKDIREFAEGRAEHNQSLKFRYLLDILVSKVREVPDCDVWLTPNDGDLAHSDLTYAGAGINNEMGSDTVPHETLRILSEAMCISDPNAPDGLNRIEALRPR